MVIGLEGDRGTEEQEEPQEMTMACYLATEGGRRCPRCGRYSRASELGWVGAYGEGVIVDAYGHLPGYGCNVVSAGETP